jgi:hypothetical protein
MVKQLEPVTFIWKDRWAAVREGPETAPARQWREADMQYGFVAEDVAAVNEKLALWELVTEEEVDENGDPVYEHDPDPEIRRPKKRETGEMVPGGWSYEKMTVIAVAAIKELTARVEELELLQQQ